MKNGDFDLGKNLPLMIFLTFYFVFAAFGLSYGVTNQADFKIDSAELEMSLEVKKLYLLDECFSYSDGVNNKAWILDKDKLTHEVLKGCIRNDFFIKVTFDEQELELYNNEAEFKNKKEFCKFKNKFLCIEKRQLVTIRDGKREFLDVMRFEVIKGEL